MLYILLLAAAPEYDPAPWYVRWLMTIPLWLVLPTLMVAGILWLLQKPINDFIAHLFDQLTDRIKRSGKEPASPEDMTRKARKAVMLEQTAERLRLHMACDHVSVYGCTNGVYLRSGDGVDKFMMLAEATKPGDPRYMDVEREVFAGDIPRTVQALAEMPYLLFWAGRNDDWKVNKLMKERDYVSSIAVFVRRPIKLPSGQTELGVIGMFVLSWRECEIYRPDQADKLPQKHTGPTRLLDEGMERMLDDYAQEFGYTM